MDWKPPARMTVTVASAIGCCVTTGNSAMTLPLAGDRWLQEQLGASSAPTPHPSIRLEAHCLLMAPPSQQIPLKIPQRLGIIRQLEHLTLNFGEMVGTSVNWSIPDHVTVSNNGQESVSPNTQTKSEAELTPMRGKLRFCHQRGGDGS